MTFIARELGKYGVTVNAYAPGAVQTAMSKFFCEDNSRPHKNINISFQTADQVNAAFGPNALSAVSVLRNCLMG